MGMFNLEELGKRDKDKLGIRLSLIKKGTVLFAVCGFICNRFSGAILLVFMQLSILFGIIHR